MLKRHAPLLVILSLVGAAMCLEVASPLVRPHDYASCAFATIARNHVEFGLGATRGASILVVDRDAPAESPVYAHHPFGYPLALAAVFSVFGASEAAARLPAILCSLGAITFLYLLMERWFDRRTAMLAAGAYGFAPVNLFYGRLVSLEQPIVFLIVATVWAWFRWLESQRRREFALVVALLILGMLTEWQAYYLCLLLPAHYWLVARHTSPKRKREGNDRFANETVSSSPTGLPSRLRFGLVSSLLRWEIVSLALLGPVMFALFLAHLAWADPAHVSALKSVFWHRVGGTQSVEAIAALGGDASYTFAEFISRLASYFLTLMLPPLVFTAAGAAIGLVVLVWRGRVAPLAASVPALLLAPAVCHTLLFHRTLFIHDCLVILYLPGVAALGGIGLRRLCVTTKVTDIRLIGAAVIIGWFLTGTIRETMFLHGEGYLHAAHLGMELAKRTRPGDDIVVIGTRYHPAVEWYGRRDVHFLDTTGPIEAIVAKHRPNLAVIFPLREQLDVESELDSRDRAARLVAARTRKAREYVEEHGREIHREDTLLLLELPSDAPKRVE